MIDGVMQVLALELLMILLENSGEVFRTSEKFSSAIKQYLCLSLLKNCTSSIPQAFALSCSIFLTLMAKFRHSLKAEIGVFFPMIMLKAIEAPQVPQGTPFGELLYIVQIAALLQGHSVWLHFQSILYETKLPETIWWLHEQAALARMSMSLQLLCCIKKVCSCHSSHAVWHVPQ